MENDKKCFNELQEELFSSLLGTGYDIEADEEGVEGLNVTGVEGDAFGVVDEEDRRILLHRDAHFGGSFSLMQEYYQYPERPGVIEDISPARIDFLAEVEKRLGRDLAPLLLSGADAERIAKMRKLYAYLKTDENQDPKNPSAAIFSRILLHEEEELELSAEELEHLQRHPEVLIQFAASDVFRDELSPGYGKAPLNAIRAIEKAKINQADEVLFRLFATAVDEEEEILLSALASRGDVVLNRVVSILTSRPITPFHEKAALLLLQFLPDERVLVCAKQQLQEKDVGNSAAAKWLELAL